MMALDVLFLAVFTVDLLVGMFVGWFWCASAPAPRRRCPREAQRERSAALEGRRAQGARNERSAE